MSYNGPNSTNVEKKRITDTYAANPACNSGASGPAGSAGSSGPAGHGHHYHAGVLNPGDAAMGSVLNQFQNMSFPGPAVQNNPDMSAHMGHAGTYMMPPTGHLMMAAVPGAAGPIGISHLEGVYAANNSAYLATHGQFQPYIPYQHLMAPFTPARAGGFQGRMDHGHADVPGLENRRGSYSTNESTPATPFYGSHANKENIPRVAVVDRSNYTTPSPQQMAANGMVNGIMVEPFKAVGAIPIPVDRNLDEILKQEPAIPKAVPAVFTPVGQMKSLDQSLENRIAGNRNVYIRGLHPTTDDDLLFKFASRFGQVETSKAIIDTSTGACKGQVHYLVCFFSFLV
jgi:hypothetical protein